MRACRFCYRYLAKRQAERTLPADAANHGRWLGVRPYTVTHFFPHKTDLRGYSAAICGHARFLDRQARPEGDMTDDDVEEIQADLQAAIDDGSSGNPELLLRASLALKAVLIWVQEWRGLYQRNHR